MLAHAERQTYLLILNCTVYNSLSARRLLYRLGILNTRYKLIYNVKNKPYMNKQSLAEKSPGIRSTSKYVANENKPSNNDGLLLAQQI